MQVFGYVLEAFLGDMLQVIAFVLLFGLFLFVVFESISDSEH